MQEKVVLLASGDQYGFVEEGAHLGGGQDIAGTSLALGAHGICGNRDPRDRTDRAGCACHEGQQPGHQQTACEELAHGALALMG